MPNPKETLSYKDAGVDIEAGNSLVERIKPLAKKTSRPGQLAGLGGFGGLFEIPPGKYTAPVLVSGTDGVGTKLKLAGEMGKHDTIGIDLVAMCVNDIIVVGAEPLFFLDYYATGHLDVDEATDVISGIAEGCIQAGAALNGGETAEMPGMYSKGDYDLAGFCVGVVEKSKILDSNNVTTDDVLLGLASSGPHSNGYSLIRKVLEISEASLEDPLGDSTLGETLLTPTKIYVKPLLELLATVDVHALAHITGGGLTENLPRVMPENIQANIDTQSWERPEIFNWLAEQGNISEDEMLRTFNCGIGMVAVLPTSSVEAAQTILAKAGIESWVIGDLSSSPESTPHVTFS